MPPTAAAHWTVAPASRLKGEVHVPGDKSISHRYVLLGGIARGVTAVSGLAPGADVASSLSCMQALGVEIAPAGTNAVRIGGRGRDALRPPGGDLDAGNSGTTMRLLAGIVAACPFATRIVGDASLSRRPMRRVIEPLSAMGAAIESVEGRPPLTIAGGPLRAIDWHSPVASAQVKTAVLLAGLAASGRTSVTEPLASRDHTERAFPAFGLRVDRQGLRSGVEGGQEATAPSAPLAVPGDPSSAAVWAAAASALPGGSVRIEGVCLNPLRLGFVAALERLGARVRLVQTGEVGGEPVGAIEVSHGGHGDTTVGAGEVPSLIDELPVLAARAALGGSLEVSGASELRVKESDRITALVSGLRTLGVDADERPDGFAVTGRRRPTGGEVDACGDHRLVMAFAIVALGATGPVRIAGADVVGVSYPGFARDLASLTA
jgi:3-phosphoshikimate 1-carboxyvinyltransferase